MNSCLSILSDTLDRKINVLHRIQKYNELQEQAFSSDYVDIDSFDRALEEKEILIQELMKLDQGFETLYERVKEQLALCRQEYKEQIRELQEKITVITELSNSVQVKEARNKKLVEKYFLKQRNNIKQGRQRAKAAYGYQQNMSGTSTSIRTTF